MFSDRVILIVGAVGGFSLFLYNVMSMDGILYRPNGQGHDTLTLSVLWDYVVAPFQYGSLKFDALWGNYDHLSFSERMNLLQLNWLAMTAAGLSVSAFVILLKCIL